MKIYSTTQGYLFMFFFLLETECSFPSLQVLLNQHLYF